MSLFIEMSNRGIKTLGFIVLLLLSLNSPNRISTSGHYDYSTMSTRDSTNYVVIIDQIYVLDDKDPGAGGEADIYFIVFKDTVYENTFGDSDSGNIKINSNGFENLNLEIYSDIFSGPVSSINITIQLMEYDANPPHDELGIVQYTIPSLSEGEYHVFKGESDNHNVKIWFRTIYGGEPTYRMYSSSFILESIHIVDDSDSDEGEIRLEVLFNGWPINSSSYPNNSEEEWSIGDGEYMKLDINFTADIISEDYVHYTHVIIMFWERDQDIFGEDYYESLGYVEINETTVFSYDSEVFDAIIPSSNVKARAIITASMSLLPPKVLIQNPENKSYNTKDIPFIFNIVNFDEVEIFLDGTQDDTIVNDSIRTLGEGNHNFTIKLSNAASATHRTIIFTIDLTAPKVTIISPVNTNYSTTARIILSYSINETVSRVIIYIDGKHTDMNGNNSEISDLSAGSHTLTVKAFDNAGNPGEKSVTFTILKAKSTPSFSYDHILITLVVLSILWWKRQRLS